MACGMHWEARRRQQKLNRNKEADEKQNHFQLMSTDVEEREQSGVHGMQCTATREAISVHGNSDKNGVKLDQDEQEFSFYNVRPNTAATYHQQKQITMESSVDENGGLDNRQCEAKQTGESTEAAPYYGYPMFMNRTMDHFGRSDQFRRWLHDDHLAKLNGNERQLELHRIGTDETYVDLLRKKFGQFQTRKARNNGFFMQ